jgi:GNAT superfamily N-acetyltransferase
MDREKATPNEHMADDHPTIRPLLEADLAQADRVFRLAFGTYLRADPPESFGGDGDCINTRWRAAPEQAFAAVVDDDIIGSVFVANWGSVGFFGPLTVRPDYWDRGVGKRLLEPVVDLFDRWGTRHAGLYTFANSQKHIALYQKFGFWPRFLTMTMTKPIARSEREPTAEWFSEVAPADRAGALASCRELTESVHEGLDVAREIESVSNQSLGDTVLLWEPFGSGLAGLAVCHIGAGTEAGSDTCYVKFATVRSGSAAGGRFTALLGECEALGASRGASILLAGVNSGRSDAYRLMLARSFRSVYSGVTMHRPNEPGYSRPDVFLIDDWR